MESCYESVFYTHGVEGEELCAGYLYKSPSAIHFKSQKSWKRRYFVLMKNTKSTCQLRYFKSEEKTKNEFLGTINLSQVSLLLMCPETHCMWKWVNQNFRCPASCVLFMKVADREYFFIGENSCDVDRWFHALYDALHNRPHRLLEPKESGRIREISAPPCSVNIDQRAEWRLQTHKASEILPDTKQEPVYAFPDKKKQ